MPSACDALLHVAFAHVINEPNVEASYQRFAALTGGTLSYAAFADAVAACLRDGLIREPIRLPEGALHCHWHLELTPHGVARARALIAAGDTQPLIPSRKEVVDGGAMSRHDG